MTDRELLCFVNKFRQLMSAGNSAKLVMDCESGCVRVILDVILQPANHPHQQPHHQAQAQRRAACPARQRRRVRRAQAREAALQVQPDHHLSRPPLLRYPLHGQLTATPIPSLQDDSSMMNSVVSYSFQVRRRKEERRRGRAEADREVSPLIVQKLKPTLTLLSLPSKEPSMKPI